MMKKIFENIWQFLGLTQERIGRRRFLIAFLTAQWGLPLAVILVMGLFYLVHGESPILFLPAVALFASLVFGLVVYIKISIRRVRDIGIAQSWWVLAIIPLVNIPFVIFLCLKKGGSGGGHFSLWNNPFTEQFKRFFSHEFSKTFIIICVGVIVAGTLYAGSVVSNLKQGIDTKIEQRGEELDTQRDTRQKQEANELASNATNFDSANASIKEKLLFARRVDECLYNKYCASLIGKQAVGESTHSRLGRYLSDKVYKELVRIKNASSFRLFFEKLGFGWWGIIALAAVFLINILIVLFKFSKGYVSLVVGAGGARAALTKTNIRNMPTFQRYILLIALLILIVLVLVLTKL